MKKIVFLAQKFGNFKKMLYFYPRLLQIHILGQKINKHFF